MSSDSRVYLHHILEEANYLISMRRSLRFEDFVVEGNTSPCGCPKP